MLKRISFIIVLGFLLNLCTSLDPPVWPNVWSQEMYINYTNVGEDARTGAKHWYDYNRKLQRVTYINSQYQLVCGSVLPNVNTPCSQIVTEGNLYVIYPAKQLCCRCCSEKFGCGVKEPHWLQSLEYVGQEKIDNQNFYKWTYINLLDYYTTQDDKRIPRRIKTNGIKVQDFILSTYSQNPISDEVWKLPSYCKKDCDRSTICGTIQPGNQGNLKVE